MKDVPESAPEIRGLLEEIVADPRSSMRLAPRRALRSWFESGDTIRPREAAVTKAERHLIEVHREELAELLCAGARIAYWKAPVLTQRPIGPDGKPYDPAGGEPSWLERAKSQVSGEPGSPGIGLLSECLTGIQPAHAWKLAQASLILVPSDRTRCYCAFTLPWSRPRTAIVHFERLVSQSRPSSLRPTILLSLGARLCAVGQYLEAREAYRQSSKLDPQAPFGWFYAFNLSCFLGDTVYASEEATNLATLVDKDDARLGEAAKVLREWWRTLSPSESSTARDISARISSSIPESAAVLCRAIEA